MAITLAEARDTLDDSALHIGASTIDSAKKDRALLAAFHEFHRVVGPDITNTNIAVASGASTLNITSTVTGFRSDDFIRAEIGYNRVELMPYDSVARRLGVTNPKTGEPSMIGFRDEDASAIIWPAADAAYTMRLTHFTGITSWTIGTTTPLSTSINIPDEWVYGVVWHGALYHLIRGAPGHPEWQAAKAEWDALLEKAQASFQRTDVPVRDLGTHPNAAKV